MVHLKFVSFGLVLLCCSYTSALGSAEDFGRSFGLDCDSGYSLSCFKKDIVSYIEKLSNSEEVNIMSGMTIVRDDTVNTTKTSEIVAGL